MSPLARAILAAIRLYQAARAGRPSPCRHVPSCSVYAAEAVSGHGALRGSGLAARRLGRCHPWGTSGVDPVPPPRAARARLSARSFAPSARTGPARRPAPEAALRPARRPSNQVV